MIKVLITEDSPVVRGFLEYVLNSDPDIEVVGAAKDGEEAVRLAAEKKPNVITMDIHMPRMDGFEATRRIMETNPVPIVICSASWNPEEVDKTFRTMEAGAVAALEKPRGMGHPDSEASVRELIQTVKLMSEVSVVRRWSRARKLAAEKQIQPRPAAETKAGQVPAGDYKVVAMGASTGGPVVIQSILSVLPKPFPVPVLIVQHIAVGFLAGLAEWLSKSTQFTVHIAADKQPLKAGHVYLSPDGFHLGVDNQFRAVLDQGDPEDNLRPAVSFLFRSVAKTLGGKSVGVLLTGMGRDGARELKLIKDKGGATFVQNKESSVVWGMPGEAAKIGAAEFILTPGEIAQKLAELVRK